MDEKHCHLFHTLLFAISSAPNTSRSLLLTSSFVNSVQRPRQRLITPMPLKLSLPHHYHIHGRPKKYCINIFLFFYAALWLAMGCIKSSRSHPFLSLGINNMCSRRKTAETKTRSKKPKSKTTKSILFLFLLLETTKRSKIP
jgi:hypothetical protein